MHVNPLGSHADAVADPGSTCVTGTDTTALSPRTVGAAHGSSDASSDAPMDGYVDDVLAFAASGHQLSDGGHPSTDALPVDGADSSSIEQWWRELAIPHPGHGTLPAATAAVMDVDDYVGPVPHGDVAVAHAP